MSTQPTMGERLSLDARHLQSLLDRISKDGYALIGPVSREGAIVFDRFTSADDLPAGLMDEVAPASYTLKKQGKGCIFDYTTPPQSIKRFLFPPSLRLFNVQLNGKGFKVDIDRGKDRFAFIGIRPCDLEAIAVQDRVFVHGEYKDIDYLKKREGLFIVAVNCIRAGGTCFCVSMGTGPEAKAGFDLAMTELIEGDNHIFLVDIGSEKGAAMMEGLPFMEAGRKEIERAEALIKEAERGMGRELDTSDLKELLYNNYDHPRWNDVADRCLSCGNCTMVCPTCFCSTIEDTTDLSGHVAERWRRWDSCFTLNHSYLHGGSVRSSVLSRYRQWMTHKLATWIDQFGTYGCVGCGRCITWCPVGIDITEEVKAIRG